MYYAHFGLVRPPFRITPDTSLFFSGADRGSVLEALAYVVMSGEGITKVIGEVGSGKTMLCRMLEEKLPERVETIYIANPNISAENILQAIAFEAGITEQPDNKMALMQQFQSWLVQCHAESKRVVVLIEEAQGMPVETLEEIRLLSNLETGEDKLMQIVLFGQPELDETLSRPEIRQLQDRIANNFYLSPLTAEQTQEYLNFRVREAGYHGPDLFDRTVSRAMLSASKGLIRRINILADKTLLVAFTHSTARITKAHVKIAMRDSKFTDSYRSFPLWQAVGGGVVAGLLIAGLCIWLFWPLQATNRVASAAVAKPAQPIAHEPVAKVEKPAISPLPEESVPEAKDSPEPLIEAQAVTVLQRRLQATKEWLLVTSDKRYSIQLMMLKASSADNLNRYLEGLPNSIDLEDIFVYETSLSGEAMFGVLYQHFATRQAALARMRDMPAAFRTIKPFLLRSIRGLRNEISDNQKVETVANNGWD